MDKTVFVYPFSDDEAVQDMHERLESFIYLMKESDDIEKSEQGWISVYKNQFVLHFRISFFSNPQALLVEQSTSKTLPRKDSRGEAR